MKILMAVVLGVVLVVIGSYYGFSLLQAQGGAVADQAGKQVTEWIGELNVRRQAVEDQITRVESKLRNQRERRIRMQVQADQFKERASALNEDLEEGKHSIAQLQKYLKKGEPVVLGGTRYKPDEIEMMLSNRIKDYKQANKQKRTYSENAQKLSAQARSLAKDERAAKRKLEDHKLKLETMEAQIQTAKATNRFSESSPDNIQGSLDQLDNSLGELEATIAVKSGGDQMSGVDTSDATRISSQRIDKDLLDKDNRKKVLQEAASITGGGEPAATSESQSP